MLTMLLMLAAEDPANVMSRAAARLSVAEAPAATSGSRWRIDGDRAVDPSAKDRAVADRGERCSVVGARVCTRPPRTWITAPID